ncbi:MAG: hypothetical protein ABR501_11165 [Pyrinomonadaceae bacterium]
MITYRKILIFKHTGVRRNAFFRTANCPEKSLRVKYSQSVRRL